MADDPNNSELIAQLESEASGLDLEALRQSLDSWLEDGDFASSLLPDLNYSMQMVAISELLHRNAQASKLLTEEIGSLAEASKTASGHYADHLVDEWVDAIHGSVFHDAANSMAAVGMVAPFIESVFTRAFTTLGQLSETEAAMAAVERRAQSQRDYWDCHFVWSRGQRREDLVQGIRQLATATGMIAHLPPNFVNFIDAILTYRNFMFHNGFEWPEDKKANFATLIEQKRWAAWFRWSTRNGNPWICYVDEVFLATWPATLREILDGVGRFVRDNVRSPE